MGPNQSAPSSGCLIESLPTYRTFLSNLIETHRSSPEGWKNSGNLNVCVSTKSSCKWEKRNGAFFQEEPCSTSRPEICPPVAILLPSPAPTDTLKVNVLIFAQVGCVRQLETATSRTSCRWAAQVIEPGGGGRGGVSDSYYDCYIGPSRSWRTCAL